MNERIADDEKMRSGGATPVRALILTSLYPSIARPRHGIFVETRMNRLVATGSVTANVVAPVPWFPFTQAQFGKYADLAKTPTNETRRGLPVAYPRYFMVPKVGLRWQAKSMAFAVLRHLRRTVSNGALPDLIDGQYLYPDGVATAIVAATLGRPYVLTARGSDVNILAEHPTVQSAILRAIEGAAITITVSSALRDALLHLGCDASRIVCLRNGVDLELFKPIDRLAARQRLGINAKYAIASVGNLVAEKRHALAINALTHLSDTIYLIVGDGSEREELKRLAIARSVRDRVVFLPNRSQRELVDIYSAVDLLVLPSSREGWPNVMLEALACGTPVVASDVGGVREMLTSNVAGIAVASSDAADFAAAIKMMLHALPDRSQVRRHAELFGWDSIVSAQADIYRRMAHQHCTGVRLH